MREASNPPEAADLDGAGSALTALRLCEDRRSSENGDAKSWPAFVEGLGKFSKSVAYAIKHPLSLWPAEGRAKLRETLEPIFKDLFPERFA
jgi:hypothetical protein